MIPALTELHLHLDGSLDLQWAYKTSLKRGAIDKDTSFNDFYKILFRTDYKNREESFRKFDIVCNCLQTKEDLLEATYNLVKHLDELGLIYAEIRFAPQQHCLKGLSQFEAVQAVIDGIHKAKKDFPNVLVKLINCMMHKGDFALHNDLENRETIEVTRRLLGNDLVALDLAGYENNCPFKDYAYLFDLAKSLNIPYTIHAGEMGEADHVIDAIDMQTKRIGHGINCALKPEILQRVIDTQTVLEVCVTSNCRNRMLYCDHPIFTLLEKGVKVTLNSDNMTFSNTCAAYEYLMLSRMGISDEVLKQCTYNSIEAAFCSPLEKQELINKIKSIYKD